MNFNLKKKKLLQNEKKKKKKKKETQIIQRQICLKVFFFSETKFGFEIRFDSDSDSTKKFGLNSFSKKKQIRIRFEIRVSKKNNDSVQKIWIRFGM